MRAGTAAGENNGTPSVTVAAAAPPSLPPEPSAVPDRTYAVFGVSDKDVLNVRAEADAKSAKVYSFGPSVANVRSTGKLATVNDTPWLEVIFDGGTGWVNRRFLREVVKGGGCNDEKLLGAIRKLMRSVANGDGKALQELVSGMRGLSVRNSRWDGGVHIPPSEVGSLYSSGQSRVWGGSGDPDIPEKVAGPFSKSIYPDLKKAVAGKGAKEKCGEVLLGGTAGMNDLPADLQGTTPVSFHFPGNENGGVDGAWHTTVATFEYVDGEPRLVALVGYRREI